MEKIKEIRMIAKFPRLIVIENDAIRKIGSICKNLRFSGSGLIICDNNTKKIAGDKISDILYDNGFINKQFIIDDATSEVVTRAEEIIKSNEVSFVLGVGGGRSIDVAKLSSYRCSLPFLTIPTAVSHDGIASSRASVRINKVNTSIKAHPPLAIIADSRILASSPTKLFNSGCGDIISNLTAIEDWKLAKRMKNENIDIFALELSELSVKLLIKNIDKIKEKNEESVNILIKSLVLSGIAMAFANSSRPASGAEHKFSHVLDRISTNPALHGEQCALGSIMMMYLHKKNWKEIRNILKKIGLPADAQEIGIPPDEIIKALTLANTIRPERYTIIDNGMTKREAEMLARKTLVIN